MSSLKEEIKNFKKMDTKKIIIILSLAGSFFFASCSNKTSTGGTASTPSTSTQQSSSSTSGSTTPNSSTHTGHSDAQTGTGSNSSSGTATSTNDQNDTNTTTGTSHSNHSGSTSTMDHSSMDGMSANMPAETKKMMMPMHNMMQKMMDMEMSGDVDHDFAHMMIEHHKGAIDMSKAVLQSGDDAKIRSIAEKSIAKQQKEIDQLSTHTKKEATTGTSQSTAGKELMATMDDTMEEMKKIEYSGDADHDYAHLLIQHHKDAIEMAKVEVQHGKDAQLKAMAQKMIEDQTKEISELEAWTKENNK